MYSREGENCRNSVVICWDLKVWNLEGLKVIDKDYIKGYIKDCECRGHFDN